MWIYSVIYRTWLTFVQVMAWCRHQVITWTNIDLSPVLCHIDPLHWCHNKSDGVSNHQPHDCLLNCSFRRGSKKTLKLRVNGLCAENSPMTGEFPAQKTSNAENVSIWWRHHAEDDFARSAQDTSLICVWKQLFQDHNRISKGVMTVSVSIENRLNVD